MKSNDEPLFIEALGDAFESLTEAQSYLDLASHRCPGCGSYRYANWEDRNTHIAIGAAITKIKSYLPREYVPFSGERSRE